ncbi:MAG: ARC6/PARC6 family protein, partial [Coleofasciculus sp. S288]|nr:ARC6/PARC6 family protein [Coleofasciculus sp. S288]
PSAVATYLAVYALIGRGFAQRQPASIARAKQMLLRLGRRQDVHLEQSVCALLLGQTEEASRALELSQEYEPLAFIREHSQGAPDLLPGLCLYGERWLQKSVFPHFRDLRHQKASLKDYFADEQVQAYLETLPIDSQGEVSDEWAVVQSQQKAAYATAAPSRGFNNEAFRRSDSYSVSDGSGTVSREAQHPAGTALQHSVSESAAVGSSWAAQREPAAVTSSRAATVGATSDRAASSVSTLPATQRVPRSPASGESSATSPAREPSGKSSRRSRHSRLGSESSKPEAIPKVPSSAGDGLDRVPPGRLQRFPDKSKSSTKTKRLVLLVVGGLLGVGILGFLLIAGLSWLQKTLQSFSAPALEGEQPLVQLAQPPIPIPEPGSQLVAPSGPLTKETALQALQTWLSTKSLALGKDHQVEQLEKILAPPVLSVWRQRAESAKQEGSYWQYEHDVLVNSVDTSAANPNRASVDAAVKEIARLYRGGQLNQAESYNENLRVRYDLVRRDGQWFISGMTVVR